MKLSRKFLSVVVAFLIFVSNNSVLLIHAQELVSPSPTAEPAIVIEDNVVIVDDTESNSNTGQNEVVVTEIVPTAVPTFSASPTSTPVIEVTTEDALSVVNVEIN